MTSQKRRPRVGDTCWEVEWCEQLAFDSNGDCDHDRCKMNVRNFDHESDARAFAESVWLKTTDAFGIVQVTPHEYVPYDEDETDPRLMGAGYWEATADSATFSGEWES